MAVRSVALKKQQPAFENDPQLFDTHPEVRLDFDRVREALQQGYTRPFLLVDTEIVRTKARRFKAAIDADWQRAAALRITAVPTFVANGRGVVGAQPYEVLERLSVIAGAARRDAEA